MFLEFCFLCILLIMVIHSQHWVLLSAENILPNISIIVTSSSLQTSFPNAFWDSSLSPLCSSKQILLHSIAALPPVLSVKWPHCLRYLPLKPESFVLAHIFSFYLLYTPFQTTGSVCSFTISLYPMLVNTALVRALFFFLRLDAFHFPLLLIFSVQSTYCCR